MKLQYKTSEQLWSCRTGGLCSEMVFQTKPDYGTSEQLWSCRTGGLCSEMVFQTKPDYGTSEQLWSCRTSSRTSDRIHEIACSPCSKDAQLQQGHHNAALKHKTPSSQKHILLWQWQQSHVCLGLPFCALTAKTGCYQSTGEGHWSAHSYQPLLGVNLS